MTDTIHVTDVCGKIDFAILTVRTDEFLTVLKQFKPHIPIIGGKQNSELCRFTRADGKLLNVAIARSFGQGHVAAGTVATQLINDLKPKFLILAGIAGGFPNRDFSLGDVLIADNFIDLSVIAAKEGNRTEFRTTGGYVHPIVETLAGSLPAWDDERLHHWNGTENLGTAKPTLVVPEIVKNGKRYYGRSETKEEVRDCLLANFPADGSIRLPRFELGTCATSNVLLKDTKLAALWLTIARQTTHVEMELGGVYSAARRTLNTEIPLLSVRGISDIVGFKRGTEWTSFACHAAASFVHAILKYLPLEMFFRGSSDSTSPQASPTVGSIEQKTRLPSIAELKDAFKKSSATLTSRVVKQEDRIPRPELNTIAEFVADDTSKTICVLGSPGSGKTALLALAAQNAMSANLPTLALKADLLPIEKPFEDWGTRELGMDISAIDAVATVSASSRVLVIIDQLDALSSTVDLQSERLDRVLQFIIACASLPNVSVICSCRSFDYQHDARFSVLDPESITLSLPEWADVAVQLEKHGIKDSEGWPASFRELLRTPQHLRIYLDRFDATGKKDTFASYHAMLDELWDRTIDTQELDVLYDLTAYLRDNELLWAPFAAFEKHRDIITRLEGKQILQRDTGRVGFQHHSLLEHSKARLFARTGQSLSDFILDRQDAIFVRPTTWAVLQYLREANLGQYRREIEKLFASKLRLHMRYLLIDFVGNVASPQEFEIGILANCLQSDDDRLRILLAIRGKAAWFDAFKASNFPTLMQLPPEQQWPVTVVLGDGWDIDRETCLNLIETYWLNDPKKDQLTWRAMKQLGKWDARAVEIVCKLIRRSPLDDLQFLAESIVATISEDKAELAPRVFVEAVNKLHLSKEPPNE